MDKEEASHFSMVIVGYEYRERDVKIKVILGFTWDSFVIISLFFLFYKRNMNVIILGVERSLRRPCVKLFLII